MIFAPYPSVRYLKLTTEAEVQGGGIQLYVTTLEKTLVKLDFPLYLSEIINQRVNGIASDKEVDNTIFESYNLTQEELAEMIDISPRSLSNIEVGACFVKSETLEKIIESLNISTEELFANNHIKTNNALLCEIDKFINKAKNDIEKFYEDDMWFVVIPLSMDAACYWGSDTEWCTATRDEDGNYFNSYNEQGPLIILINKENGEKVI